MLFQQAGAQQIVSRHAPHIGLVALPHCFQGREPALTPRLARECTGASCCEVVTGVLFRLSADHECPPLCICLAFGFRGLARDRLVTKVAQQFLLKIEKFHAERIARPRQSDPDFGFIVPGCGVITMTRSAR